MSRSGSGADHDPIPTRLGDTRTQPFGCDVAFGPASAGVAITEMGGEPDLSLDRRNAPGEPAFQVGLHRLRREIHRKVEFRAQGRGMVRHALGDKCALPRPRFSQAAAAGLRIRPGDGREINAEQTPAGHVRGQGIDDAAVEWTLAVIDRRAPIHTFSPTLR